MAKQTFTTGQVLTAAQMTSLQQTAMGGGAATAKTGSYVLTAADAGTTVIMNSGSATTITVNTALFSAGDTVFIVNQGAGVCTITAGTATVTTAGSLAMGANETGELYFLSASAAIFSEYTQTAGGGGKVLQVVSTTFATSTSIASGSYTDTGLTLAITPTLATSKVLVLTYQTFGTSRQSGQCGAGIQLLRGATVITTPSNDMFAGGASGAASVFLNNQVSISYLDSPATTSATTYKVQGKVETTANSSTLVAQYGNTTSSIILLEIGA
jgi:hypothetical protein